MQCPIDLVVDERNSICVLSTAVFSGQLHVCSKDRLRLTSNIIGCRYKLDEVSNVQVSSIASSISTYLGHYR